MTINRDGIKVKQSVLYCLIVWEGFVFRLNLFLLKGAKLKLQESKGLGFISEIAIAQAMAEPVSALHPNLDLEEPIFELRAQSCLHWSLSL